MKFICVTDIPGPPQPPFKISDIDADACTLSWSPPLEDGGSNITNYVVEKCDVSRGDWVSAISSCGKIGCRIGKLVPGREYMFRVRAENRFGISDSITSERMVAKFPFGEFTNQCINEKKICLVAYSRKFNFLNIFCHRGAR